MGVQPVPFKLKMGKTDYAHPLAVELRWSRDEFVKADIVQ